MAGKGLMRGRHFSPSQELQNELVEDIENYLQEARAIGVQHGQSMLKKQERAIVIGSYRNLFKKAKSIVAGIIDHVEEAITKALSGDQSDMVDVVSTEIDTLIDQLPDLIAETEIPAAIESAVLDTLKDGGVQKVRWVADPDACEECQQLADGDPVDIEEGWQDGLIGGPPLHPHCRCTTSPVDEE